MAKKRIKSKNLSEVLDTIPARTRAFVLSSVVGSLNMTVISVVKRALPKVVEGVTGIDAINEEMAEHDLAKVNEMQTTQQGFTPTNPLDSALDWLSLRAMCADIALGISNKEALTVEQSLDFLTSSEPRAINQEALDAIAEFVGLDKSMMTALKVRAEIEARKELDELVHRRDEVLHIVERLERDIRAFMDIDDAFTNLRPDQRYRFLTRVCKAIAKQIDRALIQMLRGSITQGAGDVKLLKAAHNDLVNICDKLVVDDQYIAGLPEAPVAI